MSIYNSASGSVCVCSADLRYEVAGQGADLLLIHGGPRDSRIWDDQFFQFAEHFRTIRYDMRGFGNATPGRDPYTFHGDAASLLDALRGKSACFAGLSLGGGAELDLTLKHPELVDALVLVGSSVSGIHLSLSSSLCSNTASAAPPTSWPSLPVELELRYWIDGPARSPEQVGPMVLA